MTDEYQKEYMVSIGKRPWGKYYVLANEDDHKVKRIEVNPGQRLSLQRHKKRDEHWFIHNGQATVTLNGKEYTLKEKEYIDIPRGSTHRMANNTDKELIFIEIQTGEYFGEDDIERLEDDYARTNL